MLDSMVSVEQIGDERSLLKQNSGSDQFKCTQASLAGNLTEIKVPIYQFGCQPTNSNSACNKEHSLLDTLLLAQWEDCSWKGLLRYDVTACETKIIGGPRKFVAQLNEEWNLNHLTEFEESKNCWPIDCCKIMEMQREVLLFCVASGKKVTSELIASADAPCDANFIIINANPVEYGHVIIVPCNLTQKMDVKSLEMARQIAVEINNSCFHIFYDNPSTSTVDHPYFQACYFANPFPVEMAPAIPFFGSWHEIGIQICEVADYPMKSLLFTGKGDSKALIEIVAKICSCLQDQNSLFNLLISDHGTKIFLFPLVQSSKIGESLSSWECGGHFVFNTKHDFELTTEEAMVVRLTASSLSDESFQSVKQLCCNVAAKYFP